MNYQTIRVDKSMYRAEGGFARQLERLDPSHQYTGTELSGLDAFERQLKRFDIKVKGPGSDTISKFFSTADSAALFPEYVSRAVAQGARESGILEEIVASRSEINSMDYRSIRTDLDDTDLSGAVAEGAPIPETNITLNEQLVKMKKRGRLLRASYEAIMFQRADVITVALKQIGAHITKASLQDAVDLLVDGGGETPAAGTVTALGATLAYEDMLALWSEFEDFEMNVLLASPEMTRELLAIPEFRDPVGGLDFARTGGLAAPLGARLIKTSAVKGNKIVALDKRFALEMVSAGGINVEYDKLIDTQLECAAVTSICGFSKIFPEAVKVLEKS